MYAYRVFYMVKCAVQINNNERKERRESRQKKNNNQHARLLNRKQRTVVRTIL